MDQAWAAFAARRRATSAAAAAPNKSTIGGAGTGAGGPPDDPVLPDELDELDEDEDELDDELLDPLDTGGGLGLSQLPLLVEVELLLDEVLVPQPGWSLPPLLPF